MRRRTRHPRTSVCFTPLTGGINTADSPDRLAEGEMVDCTNFLYETGSLTLAPRGGLSPTHTFPAAIRSLYYDVDTNVLFVFLYDLSIYTVIGESAPTLIGTLSGTRLPSCVKFQSKLYIASGDRLQSYDYSGSVTKIDSAPIADLVFFRGSRLCAAQTGSDRLRYSAIGDATSWESDANDESSGGWIDIGYGDSGDIIAVAELATDLIIIKSNGRIYQFSGDATPSAWRITPLASDADPVGTRCAAHLKGNVVFLSSRGLVSLAASADYGNITARDLGDKFRTLLDCPTDSARFFSLKRRGLLLIRPHSNKKTLIAYCIALGAATRLTFAVPVEDVCETKTDLLLAAGSALYRLTEEALTDDGTPIEYRIALRHLYGTGKLHLSALDVRLHSAHSAAAKICAEHSAHPLTAVIRTDTRALIRTNHTTDRLALVLTATSPFTAEHISASLAEL